MSTESKENEQNKDLDVNVIVQIKGLKKQKHHNNKYGIIVHHKLNSTTNRYKVRLLEDDEYKNEQTTEKRQDCPFKHLYIKAMNLLPLCKIDRSSIHKDGIFTLQSFKAGSIIFSANIPLLRCFGYSLLWKSDASNQIIKIWQSYKAMNAQKRAIFDESLHFATNNMLNIDTLRAINAFCTETIFAMQYENEFDFEKWSALILKFRLNALRDCVFYVLSKLNHSCDPNAYLTKNGQIIALQNITKKKEIFIAYFERDACLYKYSELRRMQNLKNKGFECKCFRCDALQCDDSRNFKCQFCDGIISWNAQSSRLYTKCSECAKWPSTEHQTNYMLIEKKLNLFLMKTQSEKMKKMSKELKMLLDDGQKYLIDHYLLIAFYHRLCQTNPSIKWFKMRYDAMKRIYKKPNDYLLRATSDFLKFIPLMNISSENDDEKTENNDNNQQKLMNKLQAEICFIEKALGLHL